MTKQNREDEKIKKLEFYYNEKRQTTKKKRLKF